MTINDRIGIELADIKGARFDCLKCGAAVVFDLAQWPHLPFSCPSCGQDWIIPHGEPFESLNRLRLGLLNVKALTTGTNPPPFRFTLEATKP